MSELTYRVTRKLEQADMRHTPLNGVHFIEALLHGLRSLRVGLPTNKIQQGNWFQTWVTNRMHVFVTKMVRAERSVVRHACAIPNSGCAIPGVSIYHATYRRHTSQDIHPRVKSVSPAGV